MTVTLMMYYPGGKGGQPLDTDHTQLFAQMIARTGKDIEVSVSCSSQLISERHTTVHKLFLKICRVRKIIADNA